jgi:hypothetical protein
MRHIPATTFDPIYEIRNMSAIVAKLSSMAKLRSCATGTGQDRLLSRPSPPFVACRRQQQAYGRV